MIYFKVKGETVLISLFIGLIIGASFLRMFWGSGFEEPQEDTILVEAYRLIEIKELEKLYTFLLWVPEEYRFEKFLLIIPK
jgi:hypothetical protein